MKEKLPAAGREGRTLQRQIARVKHKGRLGRFSVFGGGYQARVGRTPVKTISRNEVEAHAPGSTVFLTDQAVTAFKNLQLSDRSAVTKAILRLEGQHMRTETTNTPKSPNGMLKVAVNNLRVLYGIDSDNNRTNIIAILADPF